MFKITIGSDDVLKEFDALVRAARGLGMATEEWRLAQGEYGWRVSAPNLPNGGFELGSTPAAAQQALMWMATAWTVQARL